MSEREKQEYIGDLRTVRAWLVSMPPCARKFPEIEELINKLRDEVAARFAIESQR